jgi:hypothetical protein
MILRNDAFNRSLIRNDLDQVKTMTKSFLFILKKLTGASRVRIGKIELSDPQANEINRHSSDVWVKMTTNSEWETLSGEEGSAIENTIAMICLFYLTVTRSLSVEERVSQSIEV